MRWSAAAVTALALFSANAVAQPAPVEAYGNLPAIADAAISPDGSKVALALFDSGRSGIVVHDLNQQRRVFQIGVGEDQQLRGVGWADDGRLTYVISRTFHPGQVLPVGYYYEGRPRRVDFERTGVIDLASERAELLTTDEDNPWRDRGAWLLAPIAGEPGFGRLIGRAPGDGASHSSVFSVNLANGRVRHTPPRGTNRDTIGFLLDQAGVPVIRSDSDERSNRWRVFIYDGEAPRLLIEGVSDGGAPPAFAGLLPDGRLIAYDSDGADNFTTLATMSRDDASRTLLFQRESADIDGAILDPWTRQVVGANWTAEESHQHFFEADLQAAREQLDALLPGHPARILSWSRDRRRFLVFAEIGLDGGGYYFFDRGEQRVQRLGMAYPGLAKHPQGERQSITYRARDGVRIPAYLTYPPGDQRRDLPLVLFVHGGPHSRDSFDFDYWAAFMASRGYAVLQPNFRGSSGYGRAWEEAGRRQWGGLMQTDVEDGVAALVRAGIVNPARVCIVGASYGGYAALAGATLTPERYACAASVAGLSDLNEFLRQRAAQAGDTSMIAEWWESSIGDRAEDRERVRAVSPVNLADRVRVPILLMHGTDDTVVPILQSRRMQDRLRDAGKEVRFVELRGDDHWLSDAATRVQMLRELEAFLAQHLGAAPATH